MTIPIGQMMERDPFSGENVTVDSRRVGPGDVFVAIKGTVHDGHDHVSEALAKGASLVICEHEVSGLASGDEKKVLCVEDTKEALARVASEVFGGPSSSLKVYGVTGTNGKTTTSFLIKSILDNAGTSSGLVTTVSINTKGEDITRASMTTPDVLTLNKFLREMVSSGKTGAVVEVSSHALDQKRVHGIEFDCAVFTNITPEHLDYHGDMASYLTAKAKIFSNMKKGARAVLNSDDPLVSGLKDAIEGEVITFGISDRSYVTARNIKLSSDGTSFDMIMRGDILPVRTRLVGEHNVYNILAASGALLGDLAPDVIAEGIEKAMPVPGRLESVEGSMSFKVFVDYAHTPDALQNVLNFVRPLTEGRLICVFGCGGDRDRTKRPVMGTISTGMCDHTVLTSDNPRTEDAQSILSEIERGVSAGSDYRVILDRAEAIREALTSAREKDIVVLAGKGHEDTQVIGDKTIAFNDRRVAENILKEMGY